jgi:hypothetical protein
MNPVSATPSPPLSAFNASGEMRKEEIRGQKSENHINQKSNIINRKFFPSTP